MPRTGYAHDAVLVLAPGGDPNAVGGAIANALCGGWDHPPLCPLAPHCATYRGDGDDLTVRVLFAADPADAPRVRQRIGQALEAGELTGPDGWLTRWRLTSATEGEVRADEGELLAGLIAHGR